MRAKKCGNCKWFTESVTKDGEGICNYKLPMFLFGMIHSMMPARLVHEHDSAYDCNCWEFKTKKP